MSDNKIFEYTYSAKEQEEIKKIRERYSAPRKKEVDKMEQLRRLDASVTQKGTTAAIIIGTLSTLIMGMGMSLVMTDIGEIMGLSYVMPIGIIIGIIGMIGMILAYPIYNQITKKERKRLAPEILKLTDELLK